MKSIVICGVSLALGMAASTVEKPDAKVLAAGRGIFVQHCASCHGNDGKGGGPAAPALKSPVPDLTRVPLKDGRFDEARVRTSIDGTRAAAAHGSREMPVWGKVLATSGERRGEGAAMTDVWLLTEYVRSIQAQAGESK